MTRTLPARRRSPWRAGALALVAAAALVGGATACDDEESAATAEQNLCASMEGLSSAILVVQALDLETATRDDLESARDGIESAWQRVAEDAGDVADADTAALDDAREALDDAVSDVPDDATPREALDEVRPEATALAQTWRQVFDGLGCQGDEQP
jgi:hypothetical protein